MEDHCRALDLVIEHGKLGEVYNIGANNEKTNLEVVQHILDMMGKSRSLIAFVADRLGHDHRYALDITKIGRELGWNPSISFEEGLRKTIEWYLEQETWWCRIKSGEYADYYDRMYSQNRGLNDKA